MPERDIPGPACNGETQATILNTATKLFALRGFDAVSLRDIAKVVGIKMSSIQHYYRKKEDLWMAVLSRFEINYLHYFTWLQEENRNSNSLEELLDHFFNSEFIEMRDPMGCLGMSLVLKNQHTNEAARKCVFGLFYDHSVKCMQEDMNRLIEKGILPPADTKLIATLFMLGVMITNDVRIYDCIGTKPPLDCFEIYHGLKNMIAMAFLAPSVEGDST